ncbi:hypothetical protein E8E12_011124 [Didymella heteroderae]|uniref:Uncharacterized protein n=1 Tax=Didymella heteroderae TaxID=1769908 RepID=A0A9P5C4K0_9PLEO|nr:hypothetical protein E8E12_011124 [Didymella heteroderae]
MPFLDVLHLFFDPSATIEDEVSVFGKEWQIALEYVLHQPGLEATYTSRLTERHDLWVFLVWATEDDRSHFYHQTTGFGFVSDRLKKVPSVFFFGDDDYARLEELSRWTIHVLAAEIRNGEDKVHLHEQQENRFLEYPGRYEFAARQERVEFEKLYGGNDFDYALIGITNIGYGHSASELTPGVEFEAYKVELRRHENLAYPPSSPGSISAPTDIADLTSKLPWEYGILSYDDGEYKDTAYPMSLSFQPMSTLHMANVFRPERNRRNSMNTEAVEQYSMCIVSASMQGIAEDGRDGTAIEDLRVKLGLLDGRDGLRELRVLRAITRSAASEFVHFVCTWNTPANLTRWWQAAGSGVGAKITHTWTSDRVGWEDLEWEAMPLTPDKQLRQKVDKILEIVDFKFEDNLTDAEKTAFGRCVYDLTNTMSSCWSGDVDETPVLCAETPVWTLTGDARSSCLLFLAWDGTGQRQAWLRNFMAESYSWAGYIAHVLGVICPSVESATCHMDMLITWKEKRSSLAYGVVEEDDDDDDSDRDMGF